MSSADMPLALNRVIADPGGTLLALDFDGTLAHIVDDPARAFGHAAALDAVARLASVLGQVAIVTGRPVWQAVELGGLGARPGLDRLIVCGQYGAERWTAADGPPPHPAVLAPVERVLDALPGWLAEHDAREARIEPKGLAVAVHTRGLAPGTRDRIFAPLAVLATEYGLVAELGREVIELRSDGWDKGRVIELLASEFSVRNIVFAGDDLGDLPAYDAVDRLRSNGMNGYLICSGSDEQSALAQRADVVVPGPDGVAGWLSQLADAFGLDQGRSST